MPKAVGLAESISALRREETAPRLKESRLEFESNQAEDNQSSDSTSGLDGLKYLIPGESNPLSRSETPTTPTLRFSLYIKDYYISPPHIDTSIRLLDRH